MGSFFNKDYSYTEGVPLMMGSYLDHPDLKVIVCTVGTCDYCGSDNQPRQLFKLQEIEKKACSGCRSRALEWVPRGWLKARGIYEATERRLEAIREGGSDEGYDHETKTLTLNDGDVPMEDPRAACG